MFLCEIKKTKSINWEHVEFGDGKSHFLPFLVVYHILSETETWPFVRLLLAWIVQRCYYGILKRGLSVQVTKVNCLERKKEFDQKIEPS